MRKLFLIIALAFIGGIPAHAQILDYDWFLRSYYPQNFGLSEGYWYTGVAGATITGAGVLASGAGASFGSAWTAHAYPNDQFRQITLGTFGTDALNLAYIALRCTPVNYQCPGGGAGANDYLAIIPSITGSGGGHARIVKAVNGTQSLLCTSSVIGVAGDTWAFVAVGTTLTLYQNGTSVCPTTDSSLSSGYTGFALNSASASASDITLTQTVAGGSFTTGGLPISESSGEPVYIDMLVNEGAATHRSAGLLWAYSATQPSSSLLTPVKNSIFRGGVGGPPANYDEDPTVPANYARIGAQGAASVYLLEQLWGINYPATPAPVNSTEYAQFDALITTVVNAAISNGQTIYWEPWNEFYGYTAGGGSGTEAQFEAMWLSAYQTIKGIDATQKVVGFSSQTYNGNTWTTDLLTYCKTNSCQPDFLSWHAFASSGNGPGSISQDTVNVTSFMAANTITAPPIYIGEMIASSQAFLPGLNVKYLAMAEHAAVWRAGRSCWVWNTIDDCGANDLSGLLNPNLTTIYASWYAYRAYGQITGNLVGISNNPLMDGVAGTDSAGTSAWAVVGRSQLASTITVTFSNLNSYSGLVSNGKVYAQVFRLVSDAGTGSSGPALISAGYSSVSGNAVTFTVTSLGSDDVAIIHLSATAPGIVQVN